MTIDEVQHQIITEFRGCEDEFATYERLVALGKDHAAADEQLRSDAHALPGCQSRVWIKGTLRGGKLHFDADSDSQIIRGVLVLLLRVLSGRPPAEIADADLYFLKQVGLTTGLSPSRASGVASIIQHMRQRAADLGPVPHEK
jgi:cysteine desulfuration protein SufE